MIWAVYSERASPGFITIHTSRTADNTLSHSFFTMALYRSLFLLAIVGLSNAAPSKVQHSPDTALHPRAVCTPTAGGDSSTDDVPAITEALTSCGDGGTIVFPEGSTYYLNSVLDLGKCSNCDIQVEGLLKFASDTDYWSGRTAMISVSKVNGLKLRSLTGSGVIDGNGQDACVMKALEKEL